jgi:hypothetical protein
MILITNSDVTSMGRDTNPTSRDRANRRDMTSIPCHSFTRDLVRSMKRNGITYDTLLRQMVDQYDPEVAHE